MTTVVIAITAAIVAAIIMWLLMRNQLSALATRHELLTAQLHQTEERLSALHAEHTATQAALQQARIDAQVARQHIATSEQAHAAALSEQERRHTEAQAALRQQFDHIVAKVKAEMQTATEAMLRQRSEEFGQASRQSIDQLMAPMREKMAELNRHISDSTQRESQHHGALTTIITEMMQHSDQARRSTDELARVFRHSNSVQGSWGETVLDELLEGQGLTRGVHYDTQAYLRTPDGKRVAGDDGNAMRPDVILHLDQRREVIIDSKVSLSAFMDFVNANDEPARQRALKEHVASLQEHVRELSRKDYSRYIQPPKVRMDYVIMFVPNTGALWTALRAQPDLWRKAMEQGVYIADEQTLFAALRIIQLTWTQIHQEQNNLKVFELANEMLDRVGQFAKQYVIIGEALTKARTAYDTAQRKLLPSGQSIIQTAKKLLQLGARESTRNPIPALLDVDEVAAIDATAAGTPTAPVASVNATPAAEASAPLPQP